MKLFKKIIILVVLVAVTISASAFEREKLTHKIVVGYHFGATAPLPIPREVRKVSSYWPQFTPQLGYNISYQALDRWSIESGITLDIKGMGVRDEVKYMYTEVIMDGNKIEGYFTGTNETRMKISYVTIPIRVAYDLTKTWRLRAGGYFSYRSSSEFSGEVWGGYLRQTKNKDIINSTKIDIPNKGDATFDFGKEMKDFDMGVSLGFDHDLNRKFGIYTDMTYSLTPVFPSSFKSLNMKMKNMYVVVGISYKL